MHALRGVVHEFPLILLQPGRGIGAQHGKDNGEQQRVRLPPVIKKSNREKKQKAQCPVRRDNTAQRQHVQPEQFKDDAQRQAQLPLPGDKAEENPPEQGAIS